MSLRQVFMPRLNGLDAHNQVGRYLGAVARQRALRGVLIIKADVDKVGVVRGAKGAPLRYFPALLELAKHDVVMVAAEAVHSHPRVLYLLRLRHRHDAKRLGRES